jgi:hypothetical protein
MTSRSTPGVSSDTSRPTVTHGAYGLGIRGFASESLVSPVPESWPTVLVERRVVGEEAPACSSTGEGIVELVYPDGLSFRADRSASSITFFAPDAIADDELVHPYLSPAASCFAGWLGHTIFHSGAFLKDGEAWALLGVRTGGKSTTLARLARAGVPILTDDILVLDGESALAGPRCIDLRSDAPRELELVSQPVRGGERRRIPLPPVEPSLPIGGFFFLEWGESVSARALRPSGRLALLSSACRPETASPSTLLELARLPVWLLERPRGIETLDAVCGALLDAAKS